MDAITPIPPISAAGEFSQPRNTFPGKLSLVQKTLRLDKSNAMLFGVCSGLAQWSGVDATLIRIGFVLATLCGFGLPLLAYIAIALVAD
ncbi:PspC domain-containing protein [Novosphingopyxis sp. YJ-S2-01]|nr:PspC domain-containing protein [Novosphingopyxis sp. YJ-S2-01]